MKRAVLMVLIAGCEDFTRLEGEALDAGRRRTDAGTAGGMTAGGASGGTTAGGSSGGMTAGGASGGATAGGSSGGGAAPGGGSAGGAAGGSVAGGAAPGGGTSGGADAGSVDDGGETVPDAGTEDAGTFDAGNPPLAWSGVDVRRSPNTLLAMAASGSLLVYAERNADGGGVTLTAAPGISSPVLLSVQSILDLDARLGIASAVGPDFVSVFSNDTWSTLEVDAGTNTQLSTAPVYEPGGGPRVTLYGHSSGALLTATTSPIVSGTVQWGATVISLAVGALGTVRRVRPGGGGAFGAIVAEGPPGLHCIASANGNLTGNNYASYQFTLAASEDQRAYVSWTDSIGAPVHSFGITADGGLPDAEFSISGVAGALAALASAGERHAVVFEPVSRPTTWTTISSGYVELPANDAVVWVQGGGPDRFFSLGTETEGPYALAFGTFGNDTGLFVMASCTGGSGVCLSGLTSVISFMALP